MSPHTAPSLNVTRARLRDVTQHALGARLALETDPYLQDYPLLDVIDRNLDLAAQHIEEGNALFAHSAVKAAESALCDHPLFRVHARRPGEAHLLRGEKVAVVGNVRDRDQVIDELDAHGWEFVSVCVDQTFRDGGGILPLTGSVTLPEAARLERRLTGSLPPGLDPRAFATLLNRLADAWHDVEEQEQMCPLWYASTSRISLPILEHLPAAHEAFMWELLYPHGVHTGPLECPRASDLRDLSKQLASEHRLQVSGDGPMQDAEEETGREAAPGLLCEIADLRGRFADGYTPDDVRAVFGRINDAGGPYLVCLWEYADEYGFGGNSQFYAETDGEFREVSTDIYQWLSGERESPGAVRTWVCAPVSEPFEFAVSDDFHNYATVSEA